MFLEHQKLRSAINDPRRCFSLVLWKPDEAGGVNVSDNVMSSGAAGLGLATIDLELPEGGNGRSAREWCDAVYAEDVRSAQRGVMRRRSVVRAIARDLPWLEATAELQREAEARHARERQQRDAAKRWHEQLRDRQHENDRLQLELEQL